MTRRIMLWLGVALLAYGVWSGVALVSAFAALERADGRLAPLARAVEMGAIDGPVLASLDSLHHELASGARGLRSPVLAPVTAIPVLGGNLRALSVGADAAHTSVESLRAALVLLAGRPGMDGSAVGALSPKAGRIPVDRVGDLREPVDVLLGSARAHREALDRALPRASWKPVRVRLLRVRAMAARMERGARTAAALVRALPPLLGQERPQRYLFGAANPAELRGSGGLIGAYTIVTIDDGTVRFGEFAPVQDLPNLPVDGVAPPNADFAARYDQYGGAGYWLNLTMTPDFPSAASAMERLYERTMGERLDGVIVADPYALRALLQITGPVHVAPVGWVSAGNVVRVLANEAFGAFASQTERKQLMGAVGARVFQDFLEGAPSRDSVRSLRALATAASQGHVLLHAADPGLQELLEQAGIAGALLDPPGDYLSVVGQNGSATKLDYFAERDVSYDIALEADGSGIGHATTTLRNTAPVTGQPAYVIGPNAAGLQAGENVTILNVYCARDCAVHRFERNGVPEPLRAERELGHPVFWSYERLPSGASVDLTYSWLLPRAWSGDGQAGRYQFTFQNQVSIRPTRLRLRIALPPGMELLHAMPGLRQEADRLVWQGVLHDDLRLDVRFRAVPGRFQRWAERVLEGWAPAGSAPAPGREAEGQVGARRPADGKAHL